MSFCPFLTAASIISTSRVASKIKIECDKDCELFDVAIQSCRLGFPPLGVMEALEAKEK